MLLHLRFLWWFWSPTRHHRHHRHRHCPYPRHLLPCRPPQFPVVAFSSSCLFIIGASSSSSSSSFASSSPKTKTIQVRDPLGSVSLGTFFSFVFITRSHSLSSFIADGPSFSSCFARALCFFSWLTLREHCLLFPCVRFCYLGASRSPLASPRAIVVMRLALPASACN